MGIKIFYRKLTSKNSCLLFQEDASNLVVLPNRIWQVPIHFQYQFQLGVWSMWLILDLVSILLFAFVILSASSLLAYFLLHSLWIDSNHKNPTFVSFVLNSYAVSTFVYFTRVMPGNFVVATNLHSAVTLDHSIWTIIFIMWNLIFSALYLRLVFGNPGIIKPKGNQWQVRTNFLAELK
jgi:hypothetical protein